MCRLRGRSLRQSRDGFGLDKDGIDQRGDLVHGAIDVECEADHVDVGEAGIGGHQMGPSQVLVKSHSHNFVIAVAEGAQAAEQVAEVNQINERAGAGQQIGFVMAASYIGQLLGESPMIAEQAAGVTVGVAENLLFGDVEGQS